MLINDEIKEQRMQHNRTMLDIPPQIKDGFLPGKNLIIKLFYYETETVTSSGVIEPRYIAETSEGGRPVARLSEEQWQPRGVIIKLGEEVYTDEKNIFKVGDIVWVDPRTTANYTQFLINRDSPVDVPQGYIKVPTFGVEFIEGKYEN